MINIYSFWLNCTKNQDDKPLLSLIVDSEVRGTTLQKLIVDSGGTECTTLQSYRRWRGTRYDSSKLIVKVKVKVKVSDAFLVL